ncbi:hypothetical protein PoB_002422700 [Plakobranchus ocellatus]|uniref:Uncharacterized protein n=1 Tax=Plakobranchus ocellatus TaxID=259542 RepID=A0AAV3ZSV1_9GAST|nr:hypothetical protein PoB_002422700 [Plakobranchus ocellatus]
MDIPVSGNRTLLVKMDIILRKTIVSRIGVLSPTLFFVCIKDPNFRNRRSHKCGWSSAARFREYFIRRKKLSIILSELKQEWSKFTQATEHTHTVFSLSAKAQTVVLKILDTPPGKDRALYTLVLPLMNDQPKRPSL